MKLKQKVLQLYCCICISSCWSDSGGLEKSMEKLQAAHEGVLLLLPRQHCLVPAIPTFLSKGTHWLKRAVKKLGIKQMFARVFFAVLQTIPANWVQVVECSGSPVCCRLWAGAWPSCWEWCGLCLSSPAVLDDVPWSTGQLHQFLGLGRSCLDPAVLQLWQKVVLAISD